MTLEFKF